MIENIIRDYLIGITENTAPVYLDVPAEPPATRIVIERTGGRMVDYVRRATVAVKSYAPTLYEAAALNDKVLRWMLDIITLDDIGYIELNAEYPFNDTTTKEYRYQAVFDLVYYD